MGKRRRTEIARIADPAARLVTYSKRRKGLFNKASELSILCGVRVAVIVFSPAGKLCFFGDPELISEYIRGHDDVVPPMDLTQWEDWMQKELDSCATEEELESLIAYLETLRERLRMEFGDLEKNSSVTIGAGGDSEAGFGCNSENLSDDELDLVLESFKARCPALFEDCPCDGDGDAFLASPEKSVAGGGSWAVDSTPTCSHLEESGFNPDGFLNQLGGCVGDGDGDHDKLLTLAENSATGGRCSGEDDSMICDHEGCEFNPDEFLSLSEDWIGGGDSDSFLTLPKNSDVGGGTLREQSMPYNLEGYGYGSDFFITLENLDVLL